MIQYLKSIQNAQKYGEKGGAQTTLKLIKENEEYKEVLQNVAEIGETDYYIVSNYKFLFSDSMKVKNQ